MTTSVAAQEAQQDTPPAAAEPNLPEVEVIQGNQPPAAQPATTPKPQAAKPVQTQQAKAKPKPKPPQPQPAHLGDTGASVFVSGENLTDEFYISDREDGMKPGLGRTIWAGFQYKF